MSVTLYRPYCSLLEVQKETRNNDTAQVDWFNICINNASRAAEQMCRKDFWYHDHTTNPIACRMDWVNGPIITVPWPIQSLSEVKEDGVVVPPDQYYWESRSIYGLRHWRSFSNLRVATTGEGATNLQDQDISTGLLQDYSLSAFLSMTGSNIAMPITIKGKFGYTLASTDPDQNPPLDLPADLRRAVVLLASAWTMRNSKERIGYDGQKDSVLDSRVPKEVGDLLSRYTSYFL